MLVRSDMLCMTYDQWDKFYATFGRSIVVDLSIKKLYDEVGLISAKTVLTNEDENLFIHYLYRYDRLKRKKNENSIVL